MRQTMWCCKIVKGVRYIKSDIDGLWYLLNNSYNDKLWSERKEKIIILFSHE